MPKNVMPIKPQDVVAKKSKSMPPEVIEAFNELIAKGFSDGSSRVDQEDVVKLIVKKKGVKREKIFDNGWLDVEEIFEKAGWDVKYDKPGYCETYEAYFIFSLK